MCPGGAFRRAVLVLALAPACRAGYEEVLVERLVRSAGGTVGVDGRGTSGGAGANDAAEAGDSSNGNDPGGAAGASSSGVGGSVGGSASGGSSSSTGGSSTGASGGAGGEAGAGTSTGGGAALGGTTGGGGASGSGGSTGGGASGSGGSTGGGASGSGGSTGGGGASGSGGYAGASSLGDCQAASYGGHSYLFCNVKVPWATARDNCASIGMQIVRVDDAGENQFLADNVYASPPLQGLWLGATDAPVEGEWRWFDGELFWLGDRNGAAQSGLFNAWYVGAQPSAQQTVRDCALLDLSSQGWFDSNCTFSQEYVCEDL